MISRMDRIQEQMDEIYELFEEMKDNGEYFMDDTKKGSKNEYIRSMDALLVKVRHHKTYVKNSFVKGE